MADKAARYHRWIARAVPVTPAELGATIWSFAYFFTLLAGYYLSLIHI